MKNQFYNCEKYPAHVGGKSMETVWPNFEMPEVWDIFTETIAELQEDYSVQTHAFVLMSNHYHWLCTYEDINNDSRLFDWFHELLSFKFFHKSLDAQVAPCFRVFDKPPKVLMVDHIKAYQSTYRYIYRNPVEAGVAVRAEEYPYSTLNKILKGAELPFMCLDNMGAIRNPSGILKFINQIHH